MSTAASTWIEAVLRAHNLSWDLHVHPGKAEEGRWGDGEQVRRAAQRAGVRGFVWKSHRGKGTLSDCEKLPHSVPYALPSMTLNSEVDVGDIERGLALGVRWVWGPSRRGDQAVEWELPLPAGWAAMREVLAASKKPLVVATSHLGSSGRREFAELAGTSSAITCSVTHSLYLSDPEVRDLGELGAVFEADLYTMFHRVRDHPVADLVRRAELSWHLGSTIYLSSDAGQAATGDPYEFVAKSLAALALSTDMLEQLAVVGPGQVASRAFPEAVER